MLTLGDIIDGYSGAADASTAAARASSELQEIAQLFNSALTVPVYHVLGNHCLAANRSELLEVRLGWAAAVVVTFSNDHGVVQQQMLVTVI